MARKRDYDEEYKRSKVLGNYKNKLLRDKARRKMVRMGRAKKGDGKDVGHRKALAEGGSPLDLKNLFLQDRHSNRSFKTDKGGVKRLRKLKKPE